MQEEGETTKSFIAPISLYEGAWAYFSSYVHVQMKHAVSLEALPVWLSPSLLLPRVEVMRHHPSSSRLVEARLQAGVFYSVLNLARL